MALIQFARGLKARFTPRPATAPLSRARCPVCGMWLDIASDDWTWISVVLHEKEVYAMPRFCPRCLADKWTALGVPTMVVEKR